MVRRSDCSKIAYELLRPRPQKDISKKVHIRQTSNFVHNPFGGKIGAILGHPFWRFQKQPLGEPAGIFELPKIVSKHGSNFASPEGCARKSTFRGRALFEKCPLEIWEIVLILEVPIRKDLVKPKG